jgi:hypothetical protein
MANNNPGDLEEAQEETQQMKLFRRFLIPTGLTFAIASFLASGAAAQPASSGTGASAPVETHQGRAPDWGITSQTVKQTSITEFRRTDSTQSLSSVGTPSPYFFHYLGTPGDWWAQVKLPAGAIVDGVELDACDYSATGDIQFGMLQAPQANASDGANVPPVGTTGVAYALGCRLFTVVPPAPLTIDNFHYHYWLFLNFGEQTSALRVAGFEIYYHLQVSPAPGVATFTDVPTGYWAFQYIEALKASGITQGVTPTTYEPESPVTRAQMAVFLAKALGLHWPL